MRSCLAALMLAVVGLAGCSAPSADDLVQDLIRVRNAYEARLSSWIVREDGPQPFLYLDVMVVNNNQEESLRTLTVMVEQLDIDDNVLSSQRVPIDVAAMSPGLGQSVGVQVSPAHPAIEGIRLFIERSPERDSWSEFPELDAVRPRI